MSQKNPYKKGGMFEGASHLLFENAKNLRNNMTGAEMMLWMHIREGIDGYKFRRQHPIGLYVADFYCHKAKLIIEIDGSIHNLHDVQLQDKQKQTDLERWGYKVIRFTNKEVQQGVDLIINEIRKTINTIKSQKQNASPNGGV
jgi:cyclase